MDATGLKTSLPSDQAAALRKLASRSTESAGVASLDALTGSTWISPARTQAASLVLLAQRVREDLATDKGVAA